MNIKIICIGKLKEKYWNDAVKEYSKRLGGYCKFNVVELKESKLPSNPSRADEINVINKEGNDVINNIKDNDYVITLEIEGKQLDSLEFSKTINKLALTGKSDIIFVVGGSLGLSDFVKNRADFRLSFSNMTFPHQMMRVILLEQIYRSFKIIRNESYHK
ncbi:MAG TPA: 23S rRNA (pseudouridine(1915)-N(3))-methyltransferase RlmH [Anaerovoracaceae bacterium]|nr:23S rRNA (pseudouridine(1915)-N(3))-methyltransferase RlmH [Anaerovoracaceae bacterium]